MPAAVAAGCRATAKQKYVWTKLASSAQGPAQPRPNPAITSVPAANAVEQALLQNRAAMEALERPWRICQEQGATEVQQEPQ